MPKKLSYREQLADKQMDILLTLEKDIPRVCSDFLLSIETTTTPLTRIGYARDLRTFFYYLSMEIPEFGHFTRDDWTCEAIGKITHRQIEGFMNYLSRYYLEDSDEPIMNSDISKQRKICAVRKFMSYLFKEELIPVDNAAVVAVPKIRDKAILRLEIDEVARLLDAVENGQANTLHQSAYNENTRLRDLTIITLFLGTGIRVSELVGLNIDDLAFDSYAFLVTRKGLHEQILYFPDEVADMLQKYLPERKKIEALPGHEDALFLSLQKKRMTVRAVEYMVKKYSLMIAPLKKRMSPHKLRATYATNLYRATDDIFLVADVLGHSDVNTTRRHYAEMDQDHRRLAASKTVLRESKDEAQKIEEFNEEP